MDKLVNSKLADFFKDFSLKSFKKGEIIIWANEDPPGVIFLLQGSVGQYDIADNGQRLILNIFKPGAFFPMSWAINKPNNRYFFESLTDVECRIALPEAVVEYLRSNNDIAMDLLSRVYKGTDGLLERMTSLMAGTARSQLLLEILISSYRFGKIEKDGSARLNIKIAQLSERTGLARETVSRELKKLESEKIIKRDKGQIIVIDVSQLIK